jgi:hypothetical protein
VLHAARFTSSNAALSHSSTVVLEWTTATATNSSGAEDEIEALLFDKDRHRLFDFEWICSCWGAGQY